MLKLVPEAADKLDSLHAVLPRVAEVIEECLDWIEAGDLRARRRRFSNGLWVIQRSFAGSDWLVVWEPVGDSDDIAVRFIGETASF